MYTLVLMELIMSETKLRAAVIGGGLGGSHGYAYARAQEYELVAVCDINPEVFDRFYGRAEIARGGIGEYADYREMFAKENLDVVSVATPDHLHVDPVCDASDAGIRGILCEKPLATTLAGADCIVETIERNGTKLSVDHTRSWTPFPSGRSSGNSRRRDWPSDPHCRAYGR